jgi:hypothetical protein
VLPVRTMSFLQPPSNTPEFMNIAEKLYHSPSARIAGSIAADEETTWQCLQISLKVLRRKQNSKLSIIFQAIRQFVTPAILAIIDHKGVFDKTRSMIGRVDRLSP